MKKVVQSSHANKNSIVKKLLHSNVRLLKAEGWTKGSPVFVGAVAGCIQLIALVEWPELQADSLMPTTAQEMKKKKGPAELESEKASENKDKSGTGTGSVYDSAVMVKAFRSVIKTCSELFSNKVGSND